MEMGVGGLRQHLVQVVEHFRERLLGSAWATACLAAVELLGRGEQRPSPAVFTVVPVARIHEILGHNAALHLQACDIGIEAAAHFRTREAACRTQLASDEAAKRMGILRRDWMSLRGLGIEGVSFL